MYYIYQLTFENGQTYIGSTNNLEKRLRDHRTNCKIDKVKDRKLYKCMRQFPNFTHEVLVEENCTKIVARQLEQRFIDIHNPTLNCVKAYSTEEEKIETDIKAKKRWKDNNKEQISIKSKQYFEENKEKILLKHKQYREENKEKIAEYKKAYNREYQEQNKEQLSLKRKEWREQHKEELSKKINCDCGSIVSKSGLVKHCKTRKHLEIMDEKLKSL